MKEIKKQSAFSLIELLIVIGIIVIMTGISAAILVSTRQKRDVKAVAENIKGYLMEARSIAFTKPIAFTGDNLEVNQLDKFDLLQIRMTASTKKVEIVGRNIGSDTTTSISPEVINNLTIPAKINLESDYNVFINISDKDRESIYGQYCKDDGTPIETDSKIVLKDANNNYYNLSINRYGGIKVSAGN